MINYNLCINTLLTKEQLKHFPVRLYVSFKSLDHLVSAIVMDIVKHSEMYKPTLDEYNDVKFIKVVVDQEFIAKQTKDCIIKCIHNASATALSTKSFNFTIFCSISKTGAIVVDTQQLIDNLKSNKYLINISDEE